MRKKFDLDAEELARSKADADQKAIWSNASYDPCPFCGTQPLAAQRQGVWCNNDNCAIVGVVFSGGARHWNKRACPAQAQLFEPEVAAVPDVVGPLVEACKANEQCIEDFLQVYQRGASMLVLDEAVKSLRDDGLKVTRRALAQAATL